MTTEQQLRTALLADPGVQALIGSRLYVVQLPQNPTFPCVAYQRIATTPLNVHVLGNRQASTGTARFQFTIFAATQTGAQSVLEIADALKAALQTFNLGQQPQSPSILRGAPNFVLNEFMRIDPDIAPQPVFVAVLDTRIWFQTLT